MITASVVTAMITWLFQPIPARRDEDIERERRLQVKVTELQSKLRKLEDQCSTLTHDKQDLVGKNNVFHEEYK